MRFHSRQAKYLALFLALTSGLIVLGCSQGPVSLRFGYGAGSTTKTSAKSVGTSTTNPATIGFDQVNQAVFQISCKACHSTGGRPPTLLTFSDVKANIDAINDQVLNLHAMPKNSSLSPDQEKLLSDWINEGAPEFAAVVPTTTTPSSTGTTPPTTTTAPPPPVLWADVKAKVFASCVGCHFAKNPGALSDLTDQSQVVSSLGSIYYLSVISPVMPPPPDGTADGAYNPNQLTLAQKDLLHRWITDGMK